MVLRWRKVNVTYTDKEVGRRTMAKAQATDIVNGVDSS